MEGPVFPVYPNRALGFFALGASLHDILTRLKAQPHLYPSIHLTYSSQQPIHAPVLLSLPLNGIRLRFDGPEQRLRLIEVLDFTRCRLTYKENEIVKGVAHAHQAVTLQSSHTTGPTFRNVYNRLFGPTFPGEYVPPGSGDGQATYVLSYPGLAFSFPFLSSAWAPKTDFVSLLSSSAASPASSMAIFSGSSWADARQRLFSAPSSNPRSPVLTGRVKDVGSDEVDLVRVHGEGLIELLRRSGKSVWITLSETTPQDLVAELGPPDAIYRKNDRRLSIHRAHPIRSSQGQEGRDPMAGKGDIIDEIEHSSAHTTTDESDDESQSPVHDTRNNHTAECFYNYFRHGFDVFISAPTDPSPPLPDGGQGGSVPLRNRTNQASSSSALAATKMLLHGNVPGSYPFNRHRRSRWTLEQVLSSQTGRPLNSETAFPEISSRLKEILRDTYRDEDEERQLQKGMVLNRDWGDSPGSSCELLGGWEENLGMKDREMTKSSGGTNQVLGNTEIFGFPGMVFEVLGNHMVSCVTLF
ncbi:MAG: hypothetical protein M1816_000374 [Peltula sp. TS41687]|nr:MAG: hypothetical protein M1816_000374 [Peltula sp. TS41687]